MFAVMRKPSGKIKTTKKSWNYKKENRFEEQPGAMVIRTANRVQL